MVGDPGQVSLADWENKAGVRTRRRDGTVFAICPQSGDRQQQFDGQSDFIVPLDSHSHCTRMLAVVPTIRRHQLNAGPVPSQYPKALDGSAGSRPPSPGDLGWVTGRALIWRISDPQYPPGGVRVVKRRLGWMTSLVAVGCLARCRPVLSLAAGWNLLRRGPRDLSNCLPLLAGDVRAISGEREEVVISEKGGPLTGPPCWNGRYRSRNYCF